MKNLCKWSWPGAFWTLFFSNDWGSQKKVWRNVKISLKSGERGWAILEYYESKHRRSERVRRDRLVVRTLRCGRSNPGSNPGHGRIVFFFLNFLLQRFGCFACPGCSTWSICSPVQAFFHCSEIDNNHYLVIVDLFDRCPRVERRRTSQQWPWTTRHGTQYMFIGSFRKIDERKERPKRVPWGVNTDHHLMSLDVVSLFSDQNWWNPWIEVSAQMGREPTNVGKYQNGTSYTRECR